MRLMPYSFLPEVRGGGREAAGGAVLWFKSKIRKKEHVTPGSSREAGEGELHFRL